MENQPEHQFEPDEPVDPNEPADPTAEAFGDGLPAPRVADVEEEPDLLIDQLTDQIQGPDLEHPQDTFRPDTLLH